MKKSTLLFALAASLLAGSVFAQTPPPQDSIQQSEVKKENGPQMNTMQDHKQMNTMQDHKHMKKHHHRRHHAKKIRNHQAGN